MTAGKLSIDFLNLPMVTQFEIQKKMGLAQKGSVVKCGDGRVLDARDVKNGSGGKQGHRMKNNRLVMNKDNSAKVKGGNDVNYEHEIGEATKRSVYDADLEKESENERIEYGDAQDECVSKLKKEGEGTCKMEERGGRKEVIELDDDSNGSDVEKDKKLSESLSLDMFERVDKKLKRKYTTDMKSLCTIDEKETKLGKINQLKSMKKSLKKLAKNNQEVNVRW